MESLNQFIALHASTAHWFIFGAIILAGANIPISADLMILISALLAANVVPENTWELFLSIWLGCALSAWIAFWIGRYLENKLNKWRWFASVLNKKRREKIKSFYEKYGLWTLIIGRFIPFGIRNCLFMTAGASQMHFARFIYRDAIACTLWCSLSFYCFYTLGKNYQVLSTYVKTFNLIILASFGVTVIGIIWYKRRKSLKSSAVKKQPFIE
jgi:membrane-associated protein